MDSFARTVPLPFVYPYALVFWVLFAAVFIPEFTLIHRQGDRRPTRQDQGSKQLIMLGNMVGSWMAFGVAFWLAGDTITTDRLPVFWIGIVTIAIGALLRRHCFRMLGASFRASVDVRADQAIVERGAYRFLRHPSYAAAMLLFLGMGLALTNWASVLVFAIMVTVVYGYRIHVEEKALLATLGDPYRAYMRRTKRIVPFVW